MVTVFPFSPVFGRGVEAFIADHHVVCTRGDLDPRGFREIVGTSGYHQAAGLYFDGAFVDALEAGIADIRPRFADAKSYGNDHAACGADADYVRSKRKHSFDSFLGPVQLAIAYVVVLQIKLRIVGEKLKLVFYLRPPCPQAYKLAENLAVCSLPVYSGD